MAARLNVLGYPLSRTALLSKYIQRVSQQPVPLPKSASRQPAPRALIVAVITDPSIPLCTRTAIALAWEALLRTSEYTSTNTADPDLEFTLLRRHVDIRDAALVAEVLIPRSKSDPYNAGDSRFLLYNGAPTCAYTLLAQYMQHTRHHHPDAPLFVLPNGSCLTSAHVRAALRRHEHVAGLPRGSITPYSIRIGATFTLLDHGVPWETVKYLGRWSTDNMVMRYGRMSSLRSMTATNALTDDHAPWSVPLYSTLTR